MQSIGSLLKSIREQKNLSLTFVSQETNIAPHLLKYLEDDEFSCLPASTFTKGFIVKYAQVVGLNSQKALAVFRRDFIINQKGKIIPKGLVKPLDKTTVVTSKVAFISVVLISIILISLYLLFQLKNYNKAPEIDIVRPKPNSVVKGPIISVKGYVSADSTVYVNNAIADVFPTGEFKTSTQLQPGPQIITIKAVNSKQKNTIIEIPVTVVDK